LEWRWPVAVAPAPARHPAGGTRLNRLISGRYIRHQMTPPSGNLLGRVRRALGPGLEVDGELGSGGMGVVFAGRDPVLDRPVAIKILRPEIATGVAAERFVREGRLLAKLDHPSIIKVHQAGQADGLFYLVMDRSDGERLADRLLAGPLPVDRVVSLGAELLDAVAAIHKAGVIHRDIKPGNVLVHGDRVVLVDFGIASAGEGSDLTRPGLQPGTPAYMAPEQGVGAPATAASDLWSVGATLFEAAVGTRYDPARSRAELGALPRSLAASLGRALEVDVEKRWASALEFREALIGQTRSRRRRWAAGLAAVALVVVGLARWYFPPTTRAPARTKIVAFPIRAAAGATAPLADSITRALAARLGGYPDLELRSEGDVRSGWLELQGVLAREGEGLSLEVALRDKSRSLGVATSRVADPSRWSELADSASDAVVLAVLTDSLKRDPRVPSRVLPETPAGLRRFLDGERAYALGRWQQALAAYGEAERIDSTCLLCSYRLVDVDRWLNRPLDSARTVRLLRGADRFPPHYRILIAADTLPIADRIDSLDAASQRYRDFDLVWYRLGEEQFHRGPFVGRPSADAARAFRETVLIRPDFTPAWNHLAWISIVERDSVAADSALRVYERLERGGSGLPFVQLGLLVVANAWRFGGGANGPITSESVLEDPRIAGNRLVAAAPRMLLSLRAWDGAIWMGRRQEGGSEEKVVRVSGLIGEALGQLAAGRLDSMTAAGDRLANAASDDRIKVFGAGLPSLVALVEGDSLGRDESARLAKPLLRFLDADQAPRRAAALLVALLAQRGQHEDLARAAEAALGDDERGAGYRRLLEALDPRSPSDSIEELLAAAPHIVDEQPAARALATFIRARWLAGRGKREAAIRALRLVDHQELLDIPTDRPTRSEIEWALGPIGRWQEARWLERESAESGRRCRLFAETAIDWRRAEGKYLDRAALADSLRQVPGCGRAR